MAYPSEPEPWRLIESGLSKPCEIPSTRGREGLVASAGSLNASSSGQSGTSPSNQPPLVMNCSLIRIMMFLRRRLFLEVRDLGRPGSQKCSQPIARLDSSWSPLMIDVRNFEVVFQTRRLSHLAPTTIDLNTSPTGCSRVTCGPNGRISTTTPVTQAVAWSKMCEPFRFLVGLPHDTHQCPSSI